MADFTNIIADYNKIYDTYIDEHEIVKIDEKQPKPGAIGAIVAGDSNSQLMTFEINRYYDHIDLSNKLIKITYLYEVDKKIVINKRTEIYSDDACNICCNDKKLRFSWLLPSAAALAEGTIAATISFIGLGNEEGYELKSKIFELTVNPSICDNGSLEKATKVTWFGDIESRLYQVEQATGGATLDYETLINKPSINGVELDGDMTLDYVSGIASSTNLGGVKAVEKTAEMTYAVGVDADGFLWTKPGAAVGGGGTGSGADGFSPVVTLTAADDGTGTTLAILDKNGLKTAFIKNGTDGADGTNGTNGTNGKDGKDGVDGQDGADGFSPTVAITSTAEGTRITITDKDGDKYADIKDGKALIDDAATASTEYTWSIDKIKSYIDTTLGDIENGTY